MKKRYKSFQDYYEYLYDVQYIKYSMEHNIFPLKDVTFQVTENCCCRCSYCYEIQKNKSKYMTNETGKKIVDQLFEEYENENSLIFKKEFSAGLILSFIGGEPLMNIECIDYICTYFFDKCLEKHHPWIFNTRISITTNGTYYFNEKVQNFLKKFKDFLSFSISIDGPEEIHNRCRVYEDGSGNFSDAYKAMKHFQKNYYNDIGTKVTISPENLKDINKIVDFYLENNVKEIYANAIYEHKWTIEEGKIFYQELKKMADNILKRDDFNSIYISLFEKENFNPISIFLNNTNYCGGTGAMLAFDTEGKAYPCLRYMPSSLGNSVEPLVIGDLQTGLLGTKEYVKIKNNLDKITRSSQSEKECLDCPIALGCGWCSAWNYQTFGTINKRDTGICNIHKATALGSVYFWNKYYKKLNIKNKMLIPLLKEECLNFISNQEYEELIKLIEGNE